MIQNMNRCTSLVILCLLLALAIPFASAAGMEDDPDFTTAAVDQTADLADGTYEPDSFAVSGGTGRVKITCPEVTIQDGLSYATIQFSSSSYAYVKAAGKIIYPDIIDGKSVFIVPVALNRNNQMLGLTTKMSSPHEIEYTIFVSLTTAGIPTVWMDELDETAPEIPGFPFVEEVTCESENLKIFRYGQDVMVFEVDTGLEGLPNVLPEDEMTTSDFLAALYRAQVLKYLAFPDDVEIPAGMDKHFILIRKPFSGICAASSRVWDALTKAEITVSMNDAQEGIPYAGSYDAPDYKTLLLNKTKLLLADEAILPVLRDSMCDRLAALGIAAIVDCRSEGNDHDWQMLYHLLLNTEE